MFDVYVIWSGAVVVIEQFVSTSVDFPAVSVLGVVCELCNFCLLIVVVFLFNVIVVLGAVFVLFESPPMVFDRMCIFFSWSHPAFRCCFHKFVLISLFCVFVSA